MSIPCGEKKITCPGTGPQRQLKGELKCLLGATHTPHRNSAMLRLSRGKFEVLLIQKVLNRIHFLGFGSVKVNIRIEGGESQGNPLLTPPLACVLYSH